MTTGTPATPGAGTKGTPAKPLTAPSKKTAPARKPKRVAHAKRRVAAHIARVTHKRPKHKANAPAKPKARHRA
jgi:hypothetical protein